MEELTIIEYDKKFIPVYKTEKGTEVIRGSELHNGLNVEKAFSTWIKKQLENIDAIENIDFFPLKEESNGGRPFIEYIIKLETAKEICLVAGASPRANKELKEKSKAYRKYLINVENRFKNEILNMNSNGNIKQLNDKIDNLTNIVNKLMEQNKILLNTLNQNRNSNIETSKVNYKDENIIDDFNYSRFLNHINNLTDNTILTKKEFLNLFNSYKFYHKELGIMALNKFMNENDLIYGNDRLTDYARENNILTRDKYKNHNKVFFTKNGILYISNLLINNMHGDYKIKRK